MSLQNRRYGGVERGGGGEKNPDRNTFHDNHDHKNMLNFFGCRTSRSRQSYLNSKVLKLNLRFISDYWLISLCC